MFTTFAILAALAASPALGATVDYDFQISNVNLSPDGFQRSVVAVNGLIPGTLVTVSDLIRGSVNDSNTVLQANKGDTLRVNVTNQVRSPCAWC